MEKLDKPATFVLVHGGWVGAWLWDEVAAHLRQRDFGVIAVELPGHTPGATGTVSFEDYATTTATAIRAALADAQAVNDIYVVGHEMGGAVVQRAVELLPENPTGGNPAGLLFLESIVVADGESLAQVLPGDAIAIFEQVANLRPDQGIDMHFLDQFWQDGFMSDARNPGEAQRWLERLVPEPYPPMTQAVPLPTFATRASAGDFGGLAYILLNGDATLPDGTYKAFEQKLLSMLKSANPDARGLLHLALNTGHEAPLTRPFEVAESLIMTVTRLRVG